MAGWIWVRRGAVLAMTAGLVVLPAGHGSAEAPTAPWCANADLAVSYRVTGAAAGTRGGVIRIENVSDHACRTGGYGGVSYVGHGDGTQIGSAADRLPGRTRAHTLKPGQRLVSPIFEGTAQNYPRRSCHPVPVDGFRVYVPDATVSQYVPHPTTGCRNTTVHLLTQKPYRRP
jgi:hypothetical protein